MIFGLYRHYKGGWYLGLWTVWESTNNQPREEKVLYFSFGEKQFNVRVATEFFEGPIMSLKYPLRKSIEKGWDPVWRFTRVFPRSQPGNSLR